MNRFATKLLPRLGTVSRIQHFPYKGLKHGWIRPLSSCVHVSVNRTRISSSFSIGPYRWMHHKDMGPQTSALGITSYEDEMKNWKIDVPEFFNFASDIIDEWAEKAEKDDKAVNKTALWWIDDNGNEVKWTYPQVSEYSKKLANILEGHCGLKQGEVVLCIMGRYPEWWLVNISCIRAGLILAPGTALLTSGDIRYRLHACEAKCVIATKSIAERVDQVIDDCPSVRTKLLIDIDKDARRPGWLHYASLMEEASHNHQAVRTKSSDPMTYFFTSGTTGSPKITEHTHSSYGLGHKTTARYVLDLVPQDTLWNISDTGWAKSAYSSLFSPWLAGCCAFVHQSPTFDPKRVLQIVSGYPITVFCAPPTGYRVLVLEDMTGFTSSLRHTISAGEPLDPETSERWKELTDMTLREAYGQTETTVLCCTLRCIPNKPGSVGKVAPGIDLRIIDEDGREVPADVEGDIAVKVKPIRPLGLFSRYVNDPERTAKSYRGDYYLTGDRGCQDKDGYFWFVGRRDDVIISAGYRIGPFEIESALIEHPAVMESAAVSSPDPVRGEIVKAFVVRTQAYVTADEEKLKKELQDHTKKVTAPYKYPRKIEFVDSLPKTISGKIRRVELRDKEWKKK